MCFADAVCIHRCTGAPHYDKEMFLSENMETGTHSTAKLGIHAELHCLGFTGHAICICKS